jgi:hypothetical protein
VRCGFSDSRTGGRTYIMQIVVVSPLPPPLFEKASKTISREEVTENTTAARSVRSLWSPAHTSPETFAWFFDVFEFVVSLNSPRRTLMAPKSQFY